MFDTKVVGRKIAELRKTKNMTQVELADSMGVSYQAVSNWERGNSMPDISKLPDLVDILDCTIDQLLSSSEETELLNNIIAGSTEEYIKDKQVTIDTISNAAPVLKPKQTEEIVEMVLDEDRDTMSIYELMGIAPFVGEEYLDKLVEKIEVVEDIYELTALMPFLSEEALGKLAKRIEHIEDMNDIMALAPFLSEEILVELAMNIGKGKKKK
ncbi:MAG: helix-turn-helix transcriptional regulator [Tissierellia bacterium]|nr:helix-turn-helix transcriptional regulator [Tissierellia bacterium]